MNAFQALNISGHAVDSDKLFEMFRNTFKFPACLMVLDLYNAFNAWIFKLNYSNQTREICNGIKIMIVINHIAELMIFAGTNLDFKSENCVNKIQFSAQLEIIF